MTTLPQVISPFVPVNALNGLGLSGGQVYIGVANEDPETNPQAVYWDAAGTVPATQPLSVIGGYVCRLGTPATPYVADDFSIRALDSSGQLVFYVPSVDVAEIVTYGAGVIAALAVAVGASGAFVVNGGALGQPSTGNLSNCSSYPPTVVQNSKSANYTTLLSDAGKHIFHPSTDANARTFTIAANASVAYPIGTPVSFINMTANVVTIAITSDTLYLAGTGTTGSRSLAQYGMVTAVKIGTTSWIIGGTGLS